MEFFTENKCQIDQDIFCLIKDIGQVRTGALMIHCVCVYGLEREGRGTDGPVGMVGKYLCKSPHEQLEPKPVLFLPLKKIVSG